MLFRELKLSLCCIQIVFFSMKSFLYSPNISDSFLSATYVPAKKIYTHTLITLYYHLLCVKPLSSHKTFITTKFLIWPYNHTSLCP
jgi:hypothetical protein